MIVLQRKKRRHSSRKARIKIEPRELKKLLYKILLGVNIFFGLTLLMAYISVTINPEVFALPAFFGLAYPYFLFINILIIIIWAMLLKYEAFISVVIIALGFNHFSNYIQLFKPKADKSYTFKLLSYNVRMFNFFESSEHPSQKNVYNLIRSQKPNIFCLQEFFISGNPSQTESIVNSSTGIKYNAHIKLLGSGKNRYYGVATFSRFPIVRRGEIIHPGSSSLSIYTDVIIQQDTFRIYNNHLQSFRLKRMERSFIEELAEFNDKETFNEVKNLSARLRKGFKSRAHQAQVVKDHVKKSPYSVIVAGDFNDTPVSYAYSKIRKGLNDSFVNSGYGAGFTYKGNYPPNRIDYILYDNALINSYSEIIRVKYSDHYPIVAYFRKRN